MTTCPDKEMAKTIAGLLVERRLAACGQMFPIESIYIWQDELHDEPEIMLYIKTRTELFEKVAEAIKANHPYEVPEIVQLPIMDALPSYLRWIDQHTME
jgi:periplasmic divalent cation tolerance protein